MADPTGQPGPEQYADRLMIETLLHRLTPPQRAVLVLREVEGLDYQEIADTLEIPVGTVRSRLNAARSQFRVLWQRAMKEVSDV
jgi:RNA polymerase sigma-70 factor (ECF subfamily)